MAQTATTEPTVAATETRLPETRAALLEPQGPFRPEDLERALVRLADAGWNSIVLPALLEGYPIFPSQVWAEYGMRRQHRAFKGWNPLEIAFDIAWRRDIDILVSHAPYLAGSTARRRLPPAMRHHPEWAARRHPSRHHRSAGVTPLYNYYCPVNREYRRFVSDMLFVLLEDYPFHGLLIDLRHYPFHTGNEGQPVLWCYCEACRSRMLDDLGFDPADIDFRNEKFLVEQWKDWQAAQMDETMGYIRMRALKARDTLRVLGLLTTDTGLSDKTFRPLIDWRTWAERSLVEALVLDGFSPTPERFEEQVDADLAALPEESLLLPMLPRRSTDGAQLLGALRERPVLGVITRFDDWADEDFDPTQRVAFEQPAFPVESDPLRSICVLFENLAAIAPAEEEFVAFLTDLQRILTRGDMPLSIERLMVAADNIRGLHRKVLEGELNFGRDQDRVIHDLDLAARLAYLAGCDLPG